MNALPKELEKHNIIEQIGSSPDAKTTYVTTYSNPLIIIPKSDHQMCFRPTTPHF